MAAEGSGRLRLPADPWAEAVVVGAAVDSPQACHYAEGLDVDDFTVDLHARLFVAAMACRLPFSVEGIRTARVAHSAGVRLDLAEGLRAQAPLLADVNRTYAARVLDATRRRRLMAETVETFNALGRGEGLDAVVPVLERCLAVAAGERTGVLVAARARSLRRMDA